MCVLFVKCVLVANKTGSGNAAHLEVTSCVCVCVTNTSSLHDNDSLVCCLRVQPDGAVFSPTSLAQTPLKVKVIQGLIYKKCVQYKE